MKVISIIINIFLIIYTGILFPRCVSSAAENKISIEGTGKYQCIPCGQSCDKELYDQPGKCSQCQMKLVKKSTVTFNTIQPSDLCRFIFDHPDAVLLDVRTKEEFEGKADPDFGSLKNAINLPIQELELKISTLNKYKNKEIIVYCSHSHRSPMASYILSRNGFSKVTNLEGGMSVLRDSSCRK